MAKANDKFWRAQKNAEIERLKAKHKQPDGSVDSSSGTPFHKEYSAWLRAHTTETDWESAASDDLDRHFDARAPVCSVDQPRLPQIEAELRTSNDLRITVKEGEARRHHWAARRWMLIETRKRIVVPMDKEIAHCTAMETSYLDDEETTVDVLRRLQQEDGGMSEAAG